MLYSIRLPLRLPIGLTYKCSPVGSALGCVSIRLTPRGLLQPEGAVSLRPSDIEVLAHWLGTLYTDLNIALFILFTNARP